MKQNEITGLVCHLGILGAIEFKEFERTLTGLDEHDRNYLLRAWIALEPMPKDAAREKYLLQGALCLLRDKMIDDRLTPPAPSLIIPMSDAGSPPRRDWPPY